MFYSQDGGNTWNNSLNNFGVADEKGVGVSGSSIFAAAWDVGGHYSTNGGASFSGYVDSDGQGLNGRDTRQAIGDPLNIGYGYIAGSGCCGGPGDRWAWNGSAWGEIDNSPMVQSNPNNMAVSLSGYLLTLLPNTTSQTTVYGSTDQGNSWQIYGSGNGNPVPGSPVNIVADNETPPTVYGAIYPNQLVICPTCGFNGSWNSPIAMPWPNNYTYGGIGATAGSTMSTDRSSSDFYAVGLCCGQTEVNIGTCSAVGCAPGGDLTQAVVLRQPVGTNAWITMTGTVPSGVGVPGQLKQDEVVNTITTDAPSRAIIVGTDGTAPLLGSCTTNPPPCSVYGPATVYRLNNADVLDANHHWRPWISGLPVGTQDINWLTGQYEDGVYFIYAATWGRGIWKREARGGDL